MKKILILGMSSVLGGVETYIYNLVKNLDKSKYYFDFLVIGSEKSVFEDEINELMGDQINHFYYVDNMRGNYFKVQRWLKEFYDTHRYDMIYMNTCTAARIKYCEYPIKKYNTPLISHSHAGDAIKKLHIISNKLYCSKITRMSDVRLACSELAYDWLFTEGNGENNIVPNGIDLERFYYNLEWRKETRNEMGIKEDEILIGNVGRFSEQKNQSFLIELSKCLDNKYKIMIIGDGELKESIIAKIEKNNLQKRFVILPSQRNIEKYYSAMDIFVMPSYFEGLPIVGIEAQAEGLPCILSARISQQTSLSEFCIFRELEDVNKWKDAVIELTGVRYDGTIVVKDKGFDNMRPVEFLDNIFMKM